MRSFAWLVALSCVAGCAPKIDVEDGGSDEGSSSAEVSTTSSTTSASETSSTSSGGGTLGCCDVHVQEAGCNNAGVQDCVCAVDPSCCEAAGGWDEACVEQVGAAGCGVCPGGGTGTTTGTTDPSATTGVSVSATGSSATDTFTTTSTTGGHQACEPAPDDDACDTCLKSSCCDELAACYANPDCACLVECAQQMAGDVMTCLQDVCMVALPPEAVPLQSCASAECPDCSM